MLERWNHINNRIPFGTSSLFFDSQRRYFAENAYRDESFSKIWQKTLFFLYHRKKDTGQPKLLFYYGWLRHKANAGKMMDAISAHFDNAEFEIWHDEELFRITHKNAGFIFTRKFGRFLTFQIQFIRDYYKHRKILRLNAKQFFAFILYKSALAAYLEETILKCNIRAFITYNDYLNIAADLAFAFRSCCLNVYNIQHGILSEISYPSLSTHFLLWGEASLEKALKLGFVPANLHISGAACFEAQPATPSPEKVLLFFSQAGLQSATGVQHCAAAKNWIKEAALNLQDWKFIIRLHPDEPSGDFYRDAEHTPNITLQKYADCTVLDAISQASVCATIWSGAGIDAMLMQKILLIFTPPGFIQKTVWVKNGCTEIASADQLTHFLQHISSGDSEIIIEKQRMVLKKESINPGAAKEIAGFIKQHQ